MQVVPAMFPPVASCVTASRSCALGYVLKSDVYRTASPAVTDTDDRSSTHRMDM
jgi:hypothetical protein